MHAMVYVKETIPSHEKYKKMSTKYNIKINLVSFSNCQRTECFILMYKNTNLLGTYDVSENLLHNFGAQKN